MRSKPVTGVVLAGGRGRRMNGEDKGLIPLGREPLIARVLASLQAQVDAVMVVANRNQDDYRAYCPRVLADAVGAFDGPLAGILTALRGADSPWLAVVPCDVPGCPADMVERLLVAAETAGAPGAVVAVGEQIQPLFALLSRTLLGDLEQAWAEGVRSPRRWYHRVGLARLYYPEGCDDFLNLNTPREWRDAEQGMAARGVDS